MKKMKEILADENGQGMVEYGLILGLIAVAAIAVLVVLGPKVKGVFEAANSQMPSISASPAA